MEAVREKLDPLATKGNLNKTIKDVQAAIDQLEKAKEKINSNPSTAAFTLQGLKKPLKESFDKANADLNDCYALHNRYSKAVDKTFKAIPAFDSAQDDALLGQSYLINRAIAMHMLREGQFDVASTFIHEAHEKLPPPSLQAKGRRKELWEFNSESLQRQFSDMYEILHALRKEKNLAPAIHWARKHTAVLDSRGSNLEFDLFKLQFVRIFVGEDTDEEEMKTTGPYRALAYARGEAWQFQRRYGWEISQLCGSSVYWQNLDDSPYKHIYYHQGSWDEVATSFTGEFCSMLGLSANSPLYIAATAGAIALPTLKKAKSVMSKNRTEWTTIQEMPIEIPLPPSYHFHSIFVCPVSKEQSTDANPPMMMPCGHVICKESLDRISKGARFKCPYCPNESNPSSAKKVYM